MHIHRSIDRRSLRYWLHTQHTTWNPEISISRRGYLSLGFDLFCGEHTALIHMRLIWLLVSLSVDANCGWMKNLRDRFYARFGKYRGREFNLRYSDASATWHFFAKENESKSTDPWWMRQYFHMPWHPEWIATEVLTQDRLRVAWRDDRSIRRTIHRLRKLNVELARAAGDKLDKMKEVAQTAHSESVSCTYVLKSGVKQHVTATFYVERTYHGYRWLPFQFTRRNSIWINFDQEVGEETGSWKGGTVGCGWNLLDGEKPIAALRRMERERKFQR